jgi:hypothetical protein
LAGCGGARSDPNTIEQFRENAQAHVAEARVHTEKRLAEAERQIQALKLDLERTRKDLDHALRKELRPAAAAAETASSPAKAVGSATTGFRARATAAEKQSMDRVSAIDREIKVVEQRAQRLDVQSRGRFESAMQRVRQQLEIVSNDLGEFDHATEQTLETVQLRFEQDFSKLREHLETAKQRLP